MTTVNNSINKIKDGNMASDIIITIITAIICLITLYPMYYVLIMSVSSPREVVALNVFLYPKGFQLQSYELLVNNSEMWRAYLNTLIYTGTSTILVLVTSVLGAYPLTVPNLKFRKFFVGYLLVPMYFGGGLIPNFVLMNKLHLYNNRAAIIIPAAVSIWNIILTRTYFATIPEELRTSAQIDGANHFQILWKVYFPLSKPILAVVSIYSIVGMWNSWFNAMVYLPSTNLHPLQMYLNRVLIRQSIDLSKLNSTEIESAIEQMSTATQLKYAMIIFTTLPVIFTYPFFQKYFIKGVMVGSLKG